MSFSFQNIIVRMPNWIGDAVMATPLIEDIKANWPEANLTAMCEEGGVGALLLGNPYVDEIFKFHPPNSFLRKHGTDLVRRLQQGKFDLGVLLTNSFSSAWWLWRGKVKCRVGFARDCRSFLLTKPVPVPKERQKEHLVQTFKKLLTPFGISLSQTAPKLYVNPEEREAAKQLLAEYKIPSHGKIVGINPGAAYGSAKCWLPNRYRSVIAKLALLPDIYVVCFGDAAGAPLVHEICASMPANVINLAGTTNIRELISLIEQCRVFLTNDSGPMHIASALNIPLVALFGSTNEIATGPYQNGHVIHKHAPCSPCYLRTCPIDFRCMKEITVDEVYSAILQKL
jgi:heptosyltransferase-2